MSEFITIQVGQCGNQIGGAFWPLVLQEYGIKLDNSDGSQSPSQPHTSSNAFHSFFSSNSDGTNFKTLYDLKKNKVKARAVCIDMEDRVLARYRSGPLQHFFDDNCLLGNFCGSGNNWAEGYFSHGLQYRDDISNIVRRASEACGQLHGFLMFFSLGGGTGSGLGSFTLGLLEDQFPNVDRFVTCVYPADNEDVITSSYNVALATRELSEHATCVFPVDNKALFEICARLRTNPKTRALADTKTFNDINSVVVDMLLNLTSGSRFPGKLNVDMNELSTNMVPYPKLQYISSSLSPLCNQRLPQKSTSVDDMFSSSWSRDNQLLKIDPLSGRLLGATFITRGNLTLSAVRRNIDRFETKARFASWNRNGVKVGMCSVPPQGLDSSLLCLTNTSNISLLFQGLLDKFSKVYRRKAHVHHYLQVDGFEQLDFTESQDNLNEVIQQYQILNQDQTVSRPRLNVI